MGSITTATVSGSTNYNVRTSNSNVNKIAVSSTGTTTSSPSTGSYKSATTEYVDLSSAHTGTVSVSNSSSNSQPPATGGFISSGIRSIGNALADAVGVIEDGVSNLAKKTCTVVGGAIKKVGTGVAKFGSWVASGVKSLFSKDTWAKVGEVFKKTAATITNACFSVFQGLAKFGEAILDAGAIVGTGVASIFTGLYDGYQAIKGKITGNDNWQSVTKKMWNKTRDYVKEDRVGDSFQYIRDNTSFGNFLHDSYGYDKVYKYGAMAGEVGTMIAISIACPPAGLAIAGAHGLATGSQEAWQSGATIGEGLLAGVASGALEAGEFYIGGKFMGGGGFAKMVGSGAALGGADAALRPGITAIYAKEYYDEATGQYVKFDKNASYFDRYAAMFDDAGGIKGVAKSAATGAIISAAMYGGGKLVAGRDQRLANKLANKSEKLNAANESVSKARSELEAAQMEASRLKAAAESASAESKQAALAKAAEAEKAVKTAQKQLDSATKSAARMEKSYKRTETKVTKRIQKQVKASEEIESIEKKDITKKTETKTTEPTEVKTDPTDTSTSEGGSTKKYNQEKIDRYAEKVKAAEAKAEAQKAKVQEVTKQRDSTRRSMNNARKKLDTLKTSGASSEEIEAAQRAYEELSVKKLSLDAEVQATTDRMYEYKNAAAEKNSVLEKLGKTDTEKIEIDLERQKSIRETAEHRKASAASEVSKAKTDLSTAESSGTSDIAYQKKRLVKAEGDYKVRSREYDTYKQQYEATKARLAEAKNVSSKVESVVTNPDAVTESTGAVKTTTETTTTKTSRLTRAKQKVSEIRTKSIEKRVSTTKAKMDASSETLESLQQRQQLASARLKSEESLLSELSGEAKASYSKQVEATRKSVAELDKSVAKATKAQASAKEAYETAVARQAGEKVGVAKKVSDIKTAASEKYSSVKKSVSEKYTSVKEAASGAKAKVTDGAKTKVSSIKKKFSYESRIEAQQAKIEKLKLQSESASSKVTAASDNLRTKMSTPNSAAEKAAAIKQYEEAVAEKMAATKSVRQAEAKLDAYKVRHARTTDAIESIKSKPSTAAKKVSEIKTAASEKYASAKTSLSEAKTKITEGARSKVSSVKEMLTPEGRLAAAERAKTSAEQNLEALKVSRDLAQARLESQEEMLSQLTGDAQTSYAKQVESARKNLEQIDKNIAKATEKQVRTAEAYDRTVARQSGEKVGVAKKVSDIKTAASEKYASVKTAASETKTKLVSSAKTKVSDIKKSLSYESRIEAQQAKIERLRAQSESATSKVTAASDNLRTKMSTPNSAAEKAAAMKQYEKALAEKMAATKSVRQAEAKLEAYRARQTRVRETVESIASKRSTAAAKVSEVKSSITDRIGKTRVEYQEARLQALKAQSETATSKVTLASDELRATMSTPNSAAEKMTAMKKYERALSDKFSIDRSVRQAEAKLEAYRARQATRSTIMERVGKTTARARKIFSQQLELLKSSGAALKNSSSITMSVSTDPAIGNTTSSTISSVLSTEQPSAVAA